MNVLHVNSRGIGGGAAVAAGRLHRGLRAAGVDSRLLVFESAGAGEGVECLSGRSRWLFDAVMAKLGRIIGKTQRDPNACLCSMNLRPSPLVRKMHSMRPDLVHLHWVGFGLLPVRDLSAIKAPVVWTLHDMWPFCGSEHVNLSDGKRWKEGYRKENRHPDARGPDIARWVWEHKKKAWYGLKLDTISPSRWMQSCVSDSALWGDMEGCRHFRIPNPVDFSRFDLLSRQEAREALGLPQDRKLLGFGMAFGSHFLKGTDLLQQACARLTLEEKIDLVAVGHQSREKSPMALASVRHLGPADATRMALFYNAVDAIVVPSRCESFGFMAAEALACGTPVVAFDVGGLPDIVRHRVNGYLAAPFLIDDLVSGIRWSLKAELGNSEGRRRALRHSVSHFSSDSVVLEHKRLYEHILQC